MNKIKKISIFALAFVLLSLATSTVASADDLTEEEAAFGFGLAVCAVVAIIWFIIFI